MSLIDEFLLEVPRSERKDAKRYIMTLYDVFDILSTKGYLRISLREHAERTKFADILRSANLLFSAYNAYFNVFSKKGRSTNFARHNRKFGLTEDNVAYLLLSESITVMLRSAELFKNCFLICLNPKQKAFRSNMTLGQLIRELEKKTGGKISPLTMDIDIDLRNAMAHFLFRIQGADLIFYDSMNLKRGKVISISDLWKKGRKHSLIAQCLIRFIPDWYMGT